MHRRKRKSSCLARLKWRIGKIRAHIQSDSSLEMRLKGKKKSPSAGSKNSHCFLSDCYTYRQLQTKEAGVVGYLYFFNTQNLHHFFLVFIHLLFRRTPIASSQVLILNILATAGQGPWLKEAGEGKPLQSDLESLLWFTFWFSHLFANSNSHGFPNSHCFLSGSSRQLPRKQVVGSFEAISGAASPTSSPLWCYPASSLSGQSFWLPN